MNDVFAAVGDFVIVVISVENPIVNTKPLSLIVFGVIQKFDL